MVASTETGLNLIQAEVKRIVDGLKARAGKTLKKAFITGVGDLCREELKDILGQVGELAFVTKLSCHAQDTNRDWGHAALAGWFMAEKAAFPAQITYMVQGVESTMYLKDSKPKDEAANDHEGLLNRLTWAKNKGACFAFLKGECKRGANCKFKHVTQNQKQALPEEKPNQGPDPEPNPEANLKMNAERNAEPSPESQPLQKERDTANTKTRQGSKEMKHHHEQAAPGVAASETFGSTQKPSGRPRSLSSGDTPMAYDAVLESHVSPRKKLFGGTDPDCELPISSPRNSVSATSESLSESGHSSAEESPDPAAPASVRNRENRLRTPRKKRLKVKRRRGSGSGRGGRVSLQGSSRARAMQRNGSQQNQ